MAQRDVSYTGVAGVSGIVILSVSSGPQEWTVSQVSTECSVAPVGATCTMRKNGSIVSKMLAGGDGAGGDPPVMLRSGDTLTVTWTGLGSGAFCKATIFYDDGNA